MQIQKKYSNPIKLPTGFLLSGKVHIIVGQMDTVPPHSQILGLAWNVCRDGLNNFESL